MTEGPKKINSNSVYVGIAVLLFLINGVKFMADENSNITVLNMLFGMSIFLFIIIFLIYKDIIESRLNGRNGWT